MLKLMPQPVKFTDSMTDAWYLRTEFRKNTDSVASWKFWFPDRKVRGQDIRFETYINLILKI